MRNKGQTIRLAMLAEHAANREPVDGGVQAVTKYLIEELAKVERLEIHVLSFDDQVTRLETTKANGYTRHLVPAARSDAFSGYRRDQKTVDNVLRNLQPDIVHSQGAGHYGIVAARSQFPTVITIHGIMSEEAKHAASVRLKFRRWFISRLSARNCIRRPKDTILISEYVAQYYGKELAGPRHQIPNPVAPGFFEVKRNEKCGRILFAGRLLPLKGVHDILAAIATLDKSEELELVLAGSTDRKQYVDHLKAQAGELGMRARVKFCGILDEAALLRELSMATLLVLPSYQETAPMVIQEAMAAGVPVVASRVGGIPQMINCGETGIIVEPGEVDSLAHAMQSVLTNNSYRATLADAAKQYAESQFRAKSVAERTIAVYDEILGRH